LNRVLSEKGDIPFGGWRERLQCAFFKGQPDA